VSGPIVPKRFVKRFGPQPDGGAALNVVFARPIYITKTRAKPGKIPAHFGTKTALKTAFETSLENAFASGQKPRPKS
jgi:hypothetical protein